MRTAATTRTTLRHDDAPTSYDEPMVGPLDAPEKPSGLHPVNIGQLVMGVAFAGMVLVWALVQGDVVETDELRWLMPIPWIAAGAAGLAATVWPVAGTALAERAGRQREPPEVVEVGAQVGGVGPVRRRGGGHDRAALVEVLPEHRDGGRRRVRGPGHRAVVGVRHVGQAQRRLDRARCGGATGRSSGSKR